MSPRFFYKVLRTNFLYFCTKKKKWPDKLLMPAFQIRCKVHKRFKFDWTRKSIAEIFHHILYGLTYYRVPLLRETRYPLPSPSLYGSVGTLLKMKIAELFSQINLTQTHHFSLACYSYTIWACRLKWLVIRLFVQQFRLTTTKTSKLRIIGLCTGHRWIPLTKGHIVESVSMS